MKGLVLLYCIIIMELGTIGVEIAMVLDAYVHHVQKEHEDDFDGDDHDRILKTIRGAHRPRAYGPASVEPPTGPALGGCEGPGVTPGGFYQWA